jgi:DNA-binding NarL/FixJ family response regulator
MLPSTDLSTPVLFIDPHSIDRVHFTEALQRCSPDYRILEATDGEAGLALYRSQRIDCVILELDFLDQSGFEVLVQLVPLVRRPTVAIVVLTRLTHRGLWDLAKRNGAYACLVKEHTSGESLDYVIQGAIATIGMLPKEDRYGL